MIFSGHSQGFKCADCGYECGSTVPTSILPMLAVVGIGAGQWGKLLARFGCNWFVTLVAGLVLGVLFPYAVFQMFEIPGRLMLKKCRKCGGRLETTYSGFYDGCMPHPIELLIYVVSIVTPYLIRRMT